MSQIRRRSRSRTGIRVELSLRSIGASWTCPATGGVARRLGSGAEDCSGTFAALGSDTVRVAARGAATSGSNSVATSSAAMRAFRPARNAVTIAPIATPSRDRADGKGLHDHLSESPLETLSRGSSAELTSR